MTGKARVLVLTTAMLLGAASVALAGGGQAGDPATHKISGPAVSATIVIDPTFGSPTLGRTAIRLQKGTAFSGATFLHLEAIQGPPVGWVLGCDSVNGANPSAFGYGTFTAASLAASRFDNNRMRSWVPASVLSELFAALGITLDPVLLVPVITDLDNVSCTQITDSDFAPKFILSFTAVIQFEDQTK